MSKNNKRCQEPGCTETDTIKCKVSYLNDKGEWETDRFRYCHEHAQHNGFCYCCGLFSAGIESFDFIHPGLCDNCHDHIEAELVWDIPIEGETDYYPYPY